MRIGIVVSVVNSKKPRLKTVDDVKREQRT